MDLVALIQEETVKIPLEAVDKEEAIAELLELLVRAGRVTDRDGLLDALYEREDKGTTGIGGGVAIPHAKHPDVTGVELAVGVSDDGIDFDAADGELVYLVFLVVAEPHNPGPNVEVLADIGHLMQLPGVYQSMVSARNCDELVEAIRKVQVEL
ncbi:MAG: PTS sugar transporter subunit IIA [Candidatus Brocadiaceae bacterium]|jgi:mannitol/fructose-specific phosphotransferase system IIA component (Ntr-type)